MLGKVEYLLISAAANEPLLSSQASSKIDKSGIATCRL
jgi:hypothetical protein